MEFNIESFDDALDYVVEMVGAEFERSIALANSILEEPSKFTGPQAAITAIKLANQRYKIGVAAQYWKIKSAQTKKLDDRLIKDALMVAYDALTEMINTLKLTARHEHELAGK
jgi:hypothetical protein